MSKPIIEVKNIGKRFSITHERGRYIALRDVITNIFKRPFAFIAHKTKRAIGLEKREDFWALRNVNFTVERGEVIGIIGHNGAGKSTLLKILSRITPPTEGEIILRGRVGSLLEVGTGFHPELTGRENIFLNGAILGMRHKEITEKFDQIVEFAGIEKFLDTPVKYYSSGMYVRLAFSVAAHMEPDILVIDEVLAVGDAEFQKKCLGKMDEITKKEGRTILFVSHNMGAIKELCTKTILMDKGTIAAYGETDEIVNIYLKKLQTKNTSTLAERKDRSGDGRLRLTQCYLVDEQNEEIHAATSGKPLKVVFEYQCKPGVELKDVVIGANVVSQDGSPVFICHSEMTNTHFPTLQGSGKFVCTIDRLPLVEGTYYFSVRVNSQNIEIDSLQNVLTFEVVSGDFFGTGSTIKHSLVYIDHSWTNHEKN